jgi:trimeric autotransporter adhesin
MFEPKSKLRLIGAFAALATLALAISCRGFFVNPTLSSLAIGPANLSLSPSQAYQMVATATYSDGTTGDVTGQAVWTSSSPNIANFSAPGYIVAASLSNLSVLPGTTTVSASDGAVTSSTETVTVCPVVSTLVITIDGSQSAYDGPPVQVTFTATATVAGVQQTVTDTVTWNISNPTILPDISDGIGTLTADYPNMPFTVTATLCGVTSNTLTITTTS